MGYNLIEEAWIPVRRVSGRVERIAPWQISEVADPPRCIASPRPDFDAALLEFLVGLVQTVFTPATKTEWTELYEAGYAPDALRRRMLAERDAFFLDGDGPRFMQDLTVHHDKRVKENPIVALLIDQGTADDSALFAKNGSIRELGLPAAAAAIFTLQTFAPSGGRGQCTSLRGGGPLSVTIQDDDLWRTVWCNVLTRVDLDCLPGDPEKTAPRDRMPWMGPTRTSEAGRPSTFPQDVHPLQHFWGLPRRFRLLIDPAARGTCSIYGDRDVPVVRAFHSRPDGTSYDGPFLHPLTPYTKGQGSQPPNPKKGSRSGVPYRDWLHLAIGGEALISPRVVDVFNAQERWRVARNQRIAARGYAMDNMKPLRFVEAEVPLLNVRQPVLADLRSDVDGLVAASESVRKTLNARVKAAWSNRPGDQPGEPEARIDAAFWAESEAAFYTALREMAGAVEMDSMEDRTRIKLAFLHALQDTVHRVFDALCPLDTEGGAASLARTVRARRELDRFTNPNGKTLLACVGLAPPDDVTPRPKSRKRASDT